MIVKLRGALLLVTSEMSTQLTGPGGLVAIRHPMEPAWLFVFPLMFNEVAMDAEGATDTRLAPSRVALFIVAALATYGPTIGPPLLATPCGTTRSDEESARARARFTRPFPVSETEPAASAVRARRPTTTPFEAAWWAVTSAAAPATTAAEADVPVTAPEPDRMSTPGTPRKVSSPELDPVHRVSSRVVAETPTTFARPAG